MGINPAMNEEFLKTYKNSIESLHQAEDFENINESMFVALSENRSLTQFLHGYSNTVFNNYLNLLDKQNFQHLKRLPTGTCFPFSKKLFLTTSKKIFFCERINHKYSVGSIKNNQVDIDFEKIAETCNHYYEKMMNQCRNCFNTQACVQCMYYLEELDKKPICKNFVNENAFLRYLTNNIQAMEDKPDLYHRIMNEITIN